MFDFVIIYFKFLKTISQNICSNIYFNSDLINKTVELCFNFIFLSHDVKSKGRIQKIQFKLYLKSLVENLDIEYL